MCSHKIYEWIEKRCASGIGYDFYWPWNCNTISIPEYVEENNKIYGKSKLIINASDGLSLIPCTFEKSKINNIHMNCHVNDIDVLIQKLTAEGFNHVTVMPLGRARFCGANTMVTIEGKRRTKRINISILAYGELHTYDYDDDSAWNSRYWDHNDHDFDNSERMREHDKEMK
jgi:hypothetical protein